MPRRAPSTGGGPAPSTHEPASESDGGATHPQSAEQIALAALASKTGIALTVAGYELVGELGRGGMGVVYKALQTRLKRIVALKMILAGPHAAPEHRSRFRGEVEAVARLHHPNIVQIYEVGEHEGRPFCALEYMDGGSLDRRLKGEPQAPNLAVRLTETLARAMHAAHQKGIVHRDLKPANILLAGEAVLPLDECTLKISDFGLAKQTDDEAWRTRSGVILGTPSYMAPEQASGHMRTLGPPADIYALGAVLYELLTGRPPFRGATLFDTLDQVRTQEPVAPRQLQPKVPRDLETICLKCLQKEPAKRYATALDLAEDLRRFQAKEPIKARPTGRVERVVKWARRRPAVAALVTVTALAFLTLVGGIVFASDYKRQVAEQNLARRERLDRSLGRARDHVANRRWREAQEALKEAEAGVGAEPEQTEVKAEIDGLLSQVNDRLRNAAARERAEQTLSDFGKLRDDALLAATLTIGEDLAANLHASEKKADAALDKVGVRVKGEARPAFDAAFTHAEAEQLREDCYLLLVVRADAAGQPLPHQTPDELRRSAEDALRRLERARVFGREAQIETRAWYQRRARYLAQAGKPDEAKAAEEQAQGLEPTGALDHYLLADECYKQGDLEKAKGHFNNVLGLRPDKENFLARYFVSVCYLRLNQPSEAKAQLDGCMYQRPDLVWLHLMQGVADERLNQFAAAADDFDRAQKLLDKLDDREARYALYANRGVLRARENKIDEALKDLNRATELDAKRYQAYVALAQIHRTQALQDFKRVRPICPEPYQVCVVLAQLCAAERKRDEAVRYFDKAIAAQEPAFAILYRDRARLHLERGELKAALRDYEDAASRDKVELGTQSHDLAKDRLQCGKILFLLRRYPEAIRAYDEALGAWREFADPHLERALALVKLAEVPAYQDAVRRYRKAIRALDEALRTCPGFAEVHCRRALPLLAIPSDAAYQNALRDLEQYQQKKDKPVVALFRARALVLTKLRRYREAIAAHTMVLNLGPKSAATYAERGWLHLATHAADLARGDFERAIELDGLNAEAYNGRGQARVAQGELEEGGRDAERALRLGKEHAHLVYDAARTYALAVGKLDSDMSRLPPVTDQGKLGATRRLRRGYAERAVTLLRRALGCLPERERAEFWRERILTDGAFQPIRGSGEFAKLRAQFARADTRDTTEQ
jgi:tetratricopeptide (TPR) repeat protein